MKYQMIIRCIRSLKAARKRVVSKHFESAAAYIVPVVEELKKLPPALTVTKPRRISVASVSARPLGCCRAETLVVPSSPPAL